MEIKQICLKYFDLVGICDPSIPTRYEDIYKSWLSKGYQGDMSYLERNKERKFNPELVLAGVRSVIVLALNYYQKDNFKAGEGCVAKYARGIDYHLIIEEKQKNLIEELIKLYPEEKFKPYVDYGPSFERVYAMMSGIGWIGKNNCLITEQYGSWVFLSVIYTTLAMDFDYPLEIDKCGECNKCIKACPNKALQERELDSNRCISYHTIESKKPIPESINTAKYIFGCDICQLMCPYNQDISITTHTELLGDSSIDKNKLEQMTGDQFIKIYKNSPMTRAGRNKLLDNFRE